MELKSFELNNDQGFPNCKSELKRTSHSRSDVDSNVASSYSTIFDEFGVSHLTTRLNNFNLVA